MSNIYSSEDVNFLLGILLNDTSKCFDDKFPLDKEDFECVLLQKIVYASIYNIAINGAKSIGSMEISEFLSNYPTQEQVFKDNDGINYIETIIELTADKVDNFEYYWQSIRKHSLLRKYDNNGFDISWIWDKDESNYKNEEELNKYSIDDIIKHYNELSVKIEKEYKHDIGIEEIKLGSWLTDIKEQFKKTPMYGASWFSEYLNSATRGWIKGQLTVLSMPSSTGKSTISISNLCLIGCKELYNIEKGRYEPNPCYMGDNEGFCYMQYEMDGKTECSPKFLAFISGVPCDHILNGQYREGEEERVDKAIEILDESNIHIIVLTAVSLATIDNYIKDYKINYNCNYFCYDYIFDSATINSEIATKNKVTTRSDMVLATIAGTLKDIAVEQNVGIMTFTQTNANLEIDEIVGANAISGSRAIQNKADVGGVMHPLNKKELKVADEFMLILGKKKSFGEKKYPNRIINMYKIRFGAVEKDMKIWGYLDLSTGRFEDYWCTNRKNEPYKLDKVKLEYN